MKFTEAEIRTLRLIAQHGKAERHYDRRMVYVWRINGEGKGGRVDSLLKLKALKLSDDKSTATLSELGREVLFMCPPSSLRSSSGKFNKAAHPAAM